MSLEINLIDDSPLTTIKKDSSSRKIRFSCITQSTPMTADEILKLMENSSEELIKSDSKEEIYKNISDRRCRSDGLMNWTSYGDKCIGCQILYRLSRTSTLKNRELEISIGKYRGKKIKIFRVPGFREEYRRNKILETINNKINKGDENFFTVDNKYINYVFISSVYNYIFKDAGFYNQYLWNYGCGDKLIILKKIIPIRSVRILSQNPYFSGVRSPVENEKVEIIKEKTCFQIILQLLYICTTLRKYNFCHSEPVIKFISYMEKTNTFQLGDRDFTTPFILVLENCCSSSISFEGKRYCKFNSGKFYYQGLPVEKIDVFISPTQNFTREEYKSKEYNKARCHYYLIGNRLQGFINYMESGIPIFADSFQIICFFVSYLLDPIFYSGFSNSEIGMTIWRGLWRGEDYNLLMSDMRQLRDKKRNSTEDIRSIVRKYYIRIDALDYLVHYFTKQKENC